jgi:DNA-binding CsgD family transcriptional regulator
MSVPDRIGGGVVVDVGLAGMASAAELPREGPDGSSAVALLRQLVAQLEVGAGSRGAGADEVVLHARIDGRRYTLVRADEPAGGARRTISPREGEIVRLVARGLPNKVIAEMLDISLWTVATYLRRLFAKLGVSSRAELVARVLGEGLLDG